ncbi:hypothetical protein ACFQ6N_07420 [Kitasatospora sp. NPDC056446]|uniref:hypothetical protein n=1 Tax=Kitasatospora sp. NPDC056446 TaxID=3345819 RepID=UPI0036C7B620
MAPDERSSSRHPDREIPEDVAEILRGLDAANRAATANADELARRARPTEKERQEIASLWERAAKEIGVSDETLRDLRSVARGIGARKAPDRWTRDLPYPSESPAGPSSGAYDVHGDQPTTHTQDRGRFWWNSSDYWWDPSLTSWDGAGKRWFGGWLVCHDGHLHTLHFGLTALYELNYGRIPAAATGTFRSSPYVDTTGTLRAVAGNNFLSGDNWSKCWMHLKHELLQPTFAGFHHLGPGLQEQVIQLANVTRDGDDIAVPMNRRWPFSPIDFNERELLPNISVWAHMEVSFDVQLEGDGSELMLSWESGPAGLSMVIPEWTIAGGAVIIWP